MSEVNSIIVIDDEASIRNSFKMALEESNFKVDTADSGEKGVEMVKTNKYDLIYLDLNMPGINGVETLRRLRDFDKETPVYIITSYYTEFIMELKEASAEGYSFELLQKPINSEQIRLVTGSILKETI